MTNEKHLLKNYSSAISMWMHRYDTYEIGRHLHVPEAIVARWIANFRELAVAA